MENLIRIRLDPKRGGSTDIDFKRPCFRIHDWENSEVEIWFSDDNGSSWNKLSSTDFNYSYNFGAKRLYVSLNFDIDTISQLAFFAIESGAIGIGHTLTRYNKAGLSWTLEAPSKNNVEIGYQSGTVKDRVTGAGHSVSGVHGVNLPAGFILKNARLSNVTAGFVTADPEDNRIGISYTNGTIDLKQNSVGTWILGLGEYALDFLPLDDDTIEHLPAGAAWHKQKNVTLNGTDPEDLD